MFDIDWLREDLERVKRTILRRFNAEIHSQAAIQGVLDLKRRHQFSAAEVEWIEIETFDVAFHIIGAGKEGDKTSSVGTKEPADHSLPYVIAVAILDGDVMAAQYPVRSGSPTSLPPKRQPDCRWDGTRFSLCQVSVVEIEVTHQRSVVKRGGIRRRGTAADQCALALRLEFADLTAEDPDRFTFERAHGAAQ